VRAGQTVRGPDCGFGPGGSIKTGFANAAGVPLSHAEYCAGKVTK